MHATAARKVAEVFVDVPMELDALLLLVAAVAHLRPPLGPRARPVERHAGRVLLKDGHREPLERAARLRRRRQPVGARLLLKDERAVVAELRHRGGLHPQRRATKPEVDAGRASHAMRRVQRRQRAAVGSRRLVAGLRLGRTARRATHCHEDVVNATLLRRLHRLLRWLRCRHHRRLLLLLSLHYLLGFLDLLDLLGFRLLGLLGLLDLLGLLGLYCLLRLLRLYCLRCLLRLLLLLLWLRLLVFLVHRLLLPLPARFLRNYPSLWPTLGGEDCPVASRRRHRSDDTAPPRQSVGLFLQVGESRHVPLVQYVQQALPGARIPLQLAFRRPHYLIALQRGAVGQRRGVGLRLVPFEQRLVGPHRLEGTDHLVHDLALRKLPCDQPDAPALAHHAERRSHAFPHLVEFFVQMNSQRLEGHLRRMHYLP
mmetsp:Transcript_56248/g.167147  ORF Transcript_56248/g.167147 Transcript_56248/m.167147 type:complete len:426 (-) Transcript_56248:975-2252(-)